MNKIDVKTIQERLFLRFQGHKYHLFNSYVYDWESDYFSISNTGYSYEIEIKLSKSDFKSDFKKQKHTLFKSVIENKSRARKLPHKFFYACPFDLIEKKDIPKYAGLLYVDDYQVKTIKEAPFLHKREYDLNKILLEKFYWKSKNLDFSNRKLENDFKKISFLFEKQILGRSEQIEKITKYILEYNTSSNEEKVQLFSKEISNYFNVLIEDTKNVLKRSINKMDKNSIEKISDQTFSILKESIPKYKLFQPKTNELLFPSTYFFDISKNSFLKEIKKLK